MNTKTIIIKVGTSSITNIDGTLKTEVIDSICKASFLLKEKGHRIILVSSGAIGAGMSLLKRTASPKDLPLKQAIAAIGQAHLMESYHKAFKEYDQLCAQVLLTNDILSVPSKQRNVSQTLHTLHALEVIPIINENDTVSIAEIGNVIFSDNDTLSAIVSILVDADLLLVFSNIDGLHELKDNELTNQIIKQVDDISAIKKHISTQKSQLGRGGMTSKLDAISEATNKGIDVILTNINTINDIENIIQNHTHGTFFKGGVKNGYERNW